jgi:hypothetical protein
MEHNTLVTTDNNQHNYSFVHHLAWFCWLKLIMRFSKLEILGSFQSHKHTSMFHNTHNLQSWHVTKGRAIPEQAWTGPEGFTSWGAQISRNQHMKVVRLLALHTGCLHVPGIPLVLISVIGWVDPRALVWPERWSQSKIPMTPSGMKPNMPLNPHNI